MNAYLKSCFIVSAALGITGATVVISLYSTLGEKGYLIGTIAMSFFTGYLIHRINSDRTFPFLLKHRKAVIYGEVVFFTAVCLYVFVSDDWYSRWIILGTIGALLTNIMNSLKEHFKEVFGDGRKFEAKVRMYMELGSGTGLAIALILSYCGISISPEVCMIIQASVTWLENHTLSKMLDKA